MKLLLFLYFVNCNIPFQGTSEGHPGVNGQTLDEEKSQQAEGEWLDYSNRPIRFKPDDWQIPYWDARLYGGQQFERLLAEFKAVTEHTGTLYLSQKVTYLLTEKYFYRNF